MRVLFVANPGNSIFLTMVPLAWSLRTAGHEVRFASSPSFTDSITQAGLTAVPVGRNLKISRLLKVYNVDTESLEESRPGLAAPWDVVEDPSKADFDYQFAAHYEMVKQGHMPENFPMIGGLVEFAKAWRPDLVIWEPFSYAGAIAAKACGAVHARLLWSIDVFGLTRDLYLKLMAEQPPERRADPLGEWLGSYGPLYGYEYTEDMAVGHFTIDQFPASLQIPAGLHYVPMQHIPYNGVSVVPKWLWEKPAKPRVGITMGLTATEFFTGYTFNLQDLLDELADLDIEVVATVTEEEQRKLARIPDNARLVPFVPLNALVPSCSVVVHHAGPGTFLTAARYPIPQLALGYHFDEPIFARKLAEQGGALELAPGEASGRAIRENVLRLLHEPQFAAGAARLAEELRAMPTPNQLVPQLEELTAKYRP
ncbi:activator-dependent family glycosyltransferase [Actinoplanes sp. NEAU-A12]|uniref:Activator-dependent family glycosyltransferase n=1 Tax=Actinoplanes sandaracinus TaxID=3045177 RepID=A0ABT6WZI8_9ACTN|nr:activator-dependent family glycosyltransferase [Actinoplanes sandaracinus]MDI6105168.1 activator-dependent family glycosyltransferase [Actinoplanes sandaracinus]